MTDDPRIERIYRHAKERYPTRPEIALVEGLQPLARIALTARIARHAERFFAVHDAWPKDTFERAVVAAEKAASGNAMSVEEALSARDANMIRLHDVAKKERNEVATVAASVVRLAASCLRCPEIAYGERAFLAGSNLFHAADLTSRDLESVRLENERLNEALTTELRQLILFAETSGEKWEDPDLDGPLDNDVRRRWRRTLEPTGQLWRAAGGDERDDLERWKLIHEAVRQTGGCFYPPNLFVNSAIFEAVLRNEPRLQ